MLFDELNKKLQEAENNATAAPGERDWEKMKALLDIHLPQKKRRRRFIFWLLPLALAGFISYFGYKNGGGNKPKTSVAKKNIVSVGTEQKTGAGATNRNKQITDKETNVTNLLSGKNKNAPEISSGISEKTKKEISNSKQSDNFLPAPNNKTNRETSFSVTPKNIGIIAGAIKMKPFKTENPGNQDIEIARHITGNTESVANEKNHEKENILNENEPKDAHPKTMADTGIIMGKPIANPVADVSINEKPVEGKNVTDSTSKAADVRMLPPVADSNFTKAEIASAEKKKEEAIKKFGFTLSAGPGASGTMLTNAGRKKMELGLGVIYNISNRLSLRTGFYTSRKIYSADSAAYHPPKNFWNYFTNLQTIDADCKVFEIPFTISYHFSQKNKSGFFVATGLSSYIMKKETYNYNYKNQWGQPQQYSHIYKNENKHYFSILNFSGGYQYSFNNRFSLLAEPNVKVPITGIGYGKVRLYSSGVLFTARFNPF